MINQRGIVYTFYSFKGGVGRSMALANVAALLGKVGHRVLIIDWDLEAPGLEKYFIAPPSSLSGSRSDIPGIVDLVCGFANNQEIDWHSCLLYAHPFGEGKPVAIISAGKEIEEYVSQLQSIKWEYLFTEKNFGSYLERLREEWVQEYDFILIDSRTGITDIGGICTIHLPDILVLFFSANEQSVNGIKQVITRVQKNYESLPLDRSKLLAVPVPSRFETITENNLSIKWKNIFAETFFELYEDWVPDKITPSHILEKLFIPYIPFWSFGEGLPVITEGTGNPSSLGFAYDFLARLLGNRLKWEESLSGEITLSNELSPEITNQVLDTVYNNLNEFEQKAISNILLRLIRFDANSEESDSIIKVSENSLNIEYKDLIEKLIKTKILFRSINSLTQESVIEISQKRIIKDWGRLKNWIKENRDFLVWRQELNLRGKNWEENGKDKAELLFGGTLRKAERTLKIKERDLNQLETLYIKKSLAYENSQRIEKIIRVVLPVLMVIIALIYLYMTGKLSSSDNGNVEKDYLQAKNDTIPTSNELLLRYQLQLDSVRFERLNRDYNRRDNENKMLLYEIKKQNDKFDSLYKEIKRLRDIPTK